MSAHRRCTSTKSHSQASGEDLTDQIDRLNKALEEVMKEIEVGSVSRNQSRLSTLNNEYCADSIFHTEEDSEEPLMPSNFESIIEDLLHTIDKQQMMIEDFRSEEKRAYRKESETRDSSESRASGDSQDRHDAREPRCSHDMNKIRKQIWLQVSKQKGEQFEKDRLKYEEELRKLDELKDDYYKKRSEILLGIEKLKIKEQLLEEKEKQLKMQKLTFDKQKLVWQQERGIESTPALFQADSKASHCRSASFSYSVVNERPRVESQSKHLPMEIKPEQFTPTKQDQLKIYQIELKKLEDLLRNCLTEDNAENQMKMENLRNKIAGLRGEIAISESSKATRVINSMMASLQREVTREEKDKVLEKNGIKNIFTSKKPVPFPFQALQVRPSEKRSEDLKPVQVSPEIPLVKSPFDPNRERDDLVCRQKVLLEKEKELAQREALLQETWMRIPGSKELIENVNLTLSRLHQEKANFDREREEFSKEKSELFRTIERSMRK